MSGFLLFLDSGPCMGSYDVTRAPKTLRAVRSAAGKLDVLNLAEDAPRDDEDVFVYARHGAVGHMCTRGRGCYQTLHYRYVGPLDKVTGELRDVDDADRAWWDAQRSAALQAWAMGNPYQVPAGPPAQGSLL